MGRGMSVSMSYSFSRYFSGPIFKIPPREGNDNVRHKDVANLATDRRNTRLSRDNRRCGDSTGHREGHRRKYPQGPRTMKLPKLASCCGFAVEPKAQTTP